MDYAIEKLEEEKILLNKDLEHETQWEKVEIKQRIQEIEDALLILMRSSLQLNTDKKLSFEEYLKQIDKHFIYDDFLKGEFTYTVGDLYREYTQVIK